MSDSLIKIDPKLVDELVKQHIQVAVAEAISKNGTVLINKLVQTVVNSRCDEHGNMQRHDSYNTHNWLDWAIAKELKENIFKVIHEQITLLRPEIEKSVRAQFTKSSNAFAAAVTSGLVDSMKYDWNFKLTLGTK